MKWGVRRFQNPDGSYTPLGRARYGNHTHSIDQPKIRRIGSSDETISYDRNLYVSTNDADFDAYRERAWALPSVRSSKDKKTASVTTFEQNRPLAVANNAATVNYLFTQYDPGYIFSPQDADRMQQQYGISRKPLSYLQKYNELMTDPNARFLNYYGETGAKELLNDVVAHMPLEAKKQMFDYFRDRGYDAMLDPEDTNMIGGNAKPIWTESLVVFDPSDSLVVQGRNIVQDSVLMNLTIPIDELLK